MKRKRDVAEVDEEGPGGPSKVSKAHFPQRVPTVELSRDERQNILRNQKVLNGMVFDPVISEMNGMKDFVNMVQSQQWNHLF